MSEKMQPQEVVGILNEYLTEMTDTIFKNNGTLDKFIGDAVNLAFRLESFNKKLGTEIIISSSTYEQVKDHVSVKKYTYIKVKGKEESMTIYEALELI